MNAIQFLFRTKFYQCDAFIDDSEQPCLVFVILRDKALIAEFGDEVSLKTDLVNLLPRKDDTPHLLDLRRAIFAAVKNTADFQQAKKKWQQKMEASGDALAGNE